MKNSMYAIFTNEIIQEQDIKYAHITCKADNTISYDYRRTKLINKEIPDNI